MASDYKGPHVYENKVGMYMYEIWYEANAKKFAVIVIASNGARGSIGYVGSYVEGELLFHDWLANNIPLSSE
jgi:hypothetical protein